MTTQPGNAALAAVADPLAKAHRAELEASGIAPDVIRARPYRTASGPNDPALVAAGFKQSQRRSGGWIATLYSPLGTQGTIFKPDVPRKSKYELPAGQSMMLDAHPRSLPALGDPAIRLWVVEGVKKGDALVSRGEVAVSVSGVYGWRGRNASGGAVALSAWEAVALNGRAVYIVFDSDASSNLNVAAARERLARFLKGKGANVQIVHLPPGARGSKQGVDDFLASGGTVDGLLSLAVPFEEDSSSSRRASQTDALVRLALDAAAEFWTDTTGQAWVSFPAGGHLEHWPLRSRAARAWVAGLYWRATGGAAHSQALQDALSVLEAHAQFDGEVHAVYVRIGEAGGCIYLDLADAHWRAVEIDADGWRLTSNPPVRFRRTRGLRPLPEPQAGGSLGQLRALVNVETDDWPLIAAWLVQAGRPRGPYPVLALLGEQGSAKSSLARMLRALIDPNDAPLRAEPRDLRDLAIAANNGWIVAIDNASRLADWLSDGLCRLSTGGGLATRELYTNDEETIFSATRPIILTSIVAVAVRGDLSDRTIAITLPPIAEEARRPETELDAEFDKARPYILGALCDAVSMALRRLPEVHLERLPRMADFAIWATAAEPALGVEPGAVMAAYSRVRASGLETVIDASPIGGWIEEIADEGFTGTASELLDKAPEELRRRRSFPQSPRSLSDALHRLAPALRAVGVEVDFERAGHARRRVITIVRKGGENCVRTVRIVRVDSGNPPDADEARTNADAEPPPAPADAAGWVEAPSSGAAPSVEADHHCRPLGLHDVTCKSKQWWWHADGGGPYCLICTPPDPDVVAPRCRLCGAPAGSEEKMTR
jgi:hypothetical protein